MSDLEHDHTPATKWQGAEDMFSAPNGLGSNVSHIVLDDGNLNIGLNAFSKPEVFQSVQTALTNAGFDASVMTQVDDTIHISGANQEDVLKAINGLDEAGALRADVANDITQAMQTQYPDLDMTKTTPVAPLVEEVVAESVPERAPEPVRNHTSFDPPAGETWGSSGISSFAYDETIHPDGIRQQDVSIQFDGTKGGLQDRIIKSLEAGGFDPENISVKDIGKQQSYIVIDNVTPDDLPRAIGAMATDVDGMNVMQPRVANEVIDLVRADMPDANRVGVDVSINTEEQAKGLGHDTRTAYADVDLSRYPSSPVHYMRENSIDAVDIDGQKHSLIYTQLDMKDGMQDRQLMRVFDQEGIEYALGDDGRLNVNARADQIADVMHSNYMLPASAANDISGGITDGLRAGAKVLGAGDDLAKATSMVEDVGDMAKIARASRFGSKIPVFGSAAAAAGVVATGASAHGQSELAPEIMKGEEHADALASYQSLSATYDPLLLADSVAGFEPSGLSMIGSVPLEVSASNAYAEWAERHMPGLTNDEYHALGKGLLNGDSPRTQVLMQAASAMDDPSVLPESLHGLVEKRDEYFTARSESVNESARLGGTTANMTNGSQEYLAELETYHQYTRTDLIRNMEEVGSTVEGMNNILNVLPLDDRIEYARSLAMSDPKLAERSGEMAAYVEGHENSNLIGRTLWGVEGEDVFEENPQLVNDYILARLGIDDNGPSPDHHIGNDADQNSRGLMAGADDVSTPDNIADFGAFSTADGGTYTGDATLHADAVVAGVHADMPAADNDDRSPVHQVAPTNYSLS